jgi:uncharacterized heparinase superfamily protein
VVFNDVSSCRFLESGSIKRLFGGSPIVAGPNNVTVMREETPDGAMLRASHDGYAERFGAVHQRTLMLTKDGDHLEGEDVFTSSVGDQLPREDEFAIRFHLHPMVQATLLSDGRGAMLMLPDRDVWNFNAYEDVVELEESVYLAGAEGPGRTTQIVIYGKGRRAPRVRWSFTHRAPAAGEQQTGHDEQPWLPL